MVLPDEVLEELRGYDAILLGAIGPPVGDTSVPPGTLERGLLLRLRFELDLYINLRPFHGVPGSIAAGADFVVIRENTEGTYAGEGGALRKGTRTRWPPRARSTPAWGSSAACASPSNWRSAARPATSPWCTRPTCSPSPATCGSARSPRWRPEYPDVTWDYNHVDAACIYMVENPGSLRRHRDRQPLR